MSLLRRALALSALAAFGCTDRAPAAGDDRLVVFGPSLAQLMYQGGLGDRIVGLDRYSSPAPGCTAPADVGGYLDPSLEVVASLEPTSIHVAGCSRELSSLASSLGVPLFTYSFDRIDDVFAAMDSIDSRYGTDLSWLRERTESVLDSIGALAGPESVSLVIVVWHDPGSGSMTVSGRETFLGDMAARMGLDLLAPPSGTYPSVSVEGVLEMSPDHIVMLLPQSARDSLRVTEEETAFWESFGYPRERVHCAFGKDLLVPGASMASTARRIASCVL